MRQLVSIVIANWNGLKYLNDCLDSLLRQTYSPIEIILVDNGSEDGSPDFIKEKYNSIKIIRNKTNMGFASATNNGIKHAEGELIALFNQDAMADEKWLERLVEVVMSSKDVAAAAGKIFYLRNGRKDNSVFCTWPKINPFTAAPYNFSGHEGASAVDYLTGCAMIIKKDIIDEIGDIDEGYFLYFEETDWCARIIRAGYKLMYVPDAVVWHVVSGSISVPSMKLSYMVRNRIRFALKNFDLEYIPVFLLSFSIETFIDITKDLYNTDLGAIKLRVEAIIWNILNIKITVNARKRDHSRIRNIRSYNRSLPLREYRLGIVEKLLAR
jgi:GT2 family glycosyltransferase